MHNKQELYNLMTVKKIKSLVIQCFSERLTIKRSDIENEITKIPNSNAVKVFFFIL